MLLPETLPCIKQAGSAWILRQICHDWPDQQVLQILKSVRAAMGAAKPPCTLCLVEVFCAPSNLYHQKLCSRLKPLILKPATG